jgi:hypothetical protein
MRRACAAFDVLPFAERHAFFQLVLEAGDLDGAARDAGRQCFRDRAAREAGPGSDPGYSRGGVRGDREGEEAMTDGSMRHRPISRPICIQEALSELARGP